MIATARHNGKDLGTATARFMAQRDDSETLNQYGVQSTNRQLGVQVNIPIYSGGGISSATRQAAANYGRAQAELDALIAYLQVLGTLVRTTAASG